MNEREFAQNLTRQLNRAPLAADTAQRLRAAREAALARAAVRPAGGMHGAGGVLVRFWHQHPAVGIGLLLTLLVALAGAGWQWQQVREADRALEARLLADELPVELFLNERF